MYVYIQGRKQRGERGRANENCFEVCFVEIVVERNYVWCLVIVVIFKESRGAKRSEVRDTIIWCGNASHKGKRRGQYLWRMVVICCAETLLSVLQGSAKDFRRYVFSLYYCCFTCFVSIDIGKTNSAI